MGIERFTFVKVNLQGLISLGFEILRMTFETTISAVVDCFIRNSKSVSVNLIGIAYNVQPMYNYNYNYHQVRRVNQ